jgi:DNA polymerase I-like protein with 3'-5' exonuclease and polymerase domains
MEVSMLQWLSQDEELGKILKKDVYEEIYKVVTGILDEPAEQSRSTAKQFFLPVYYGLGATGLAESLGISFTAAQSIINSMKMNFNKSFEWIEDQQERAKTGVAVDYFGRTRAVGDDHYKARHFSVAAPAALVCMEKLIELHNLLPNNLIMSVHDGYYFAANRSNFGAIVRAVEGTLEAESKFCPGLRLKTKCTVGKSLSGMKEYERNRKVGSKVS